MVLTPAAPPEKGMPENAISYDGPIDLIGNPHCLAEGICAALCDAEIFNFASLLRKRVMPIEMEPRREQP